jgi:hypothetical protein
MRLIIAGGRDYRFSVDDFVRLEKLHRERAVTERALRPPQSALTFAPLGLRSGSAISAAPSGGNR